MAGTEYKLLVSSKNIPTEVKVIPITADTETIILQRNMMVAVEVFIQTRTGNAAISLNQEPSFTINAVGNITIDNCVIERINMTGSTAGEILLFLVNINEALAKGWIGRS